MADAPRPSDEAEKAAETTALSLAQAHEALKAQGQAMRDLQGRMTQLETLLHRALESVFPRVDSLLLGLEAQQQQRPSVAEWGQKEERGRGALGPELRCARALGDELLRALHKGRPDDVRWLVDAGADLGVCDGDGLTALHWAASNGHTEVVTLLLERGADVHARSSFGCTPLHWAASNDRSAACVQLLLDAATDFRCTNNDGNTPLHSAAMCGNEAAARALLAAGAGSSVRNADGRTPADMALGEALRGVLLAHVQEERSP